MLNDGSKGLKTSSASSSALGAGLLDGAADAAARSLPLDHQSSEPDVEDDIRPPATAFIESSAGERVSALQLFEKAETKATAEQVGEASRVKLMFVGICLLEVVANFDAGVLPACVAHVMQEFELDYSDGGVLGALVYIGMVLGTPVAGYCLTIKPQNLLLCAAAALNAVATVMFALAPDGNTSILYLGRMLMGVSQGPIFVYCPVWVDEFAPTGLQATWMAGLQGSVVLGIVLGYIVAGSFVTNWMPMTCPAFLTAEGIGQLMPTTSIHRLSEITAGNSTFADGLPDVYAARVRGAAGPLAAGQELAGGGEDDEVVRLGDLGCYNQHWKVSLLIQAACMACFVGIFLVVQSRHVNAKGGQKERFRFRRGQLYRQMIAELSPTNIDEAASMAIMDHRASSKLAVARFKENVVQSSLVTTTVELYRESLAHEVLSSPRRAPKIGAAGGGQHLGGAGGPGVGVATPGLIAASSYDGSMQNMHQAVSDNSVRTVGLMELFASKADLASGQAGGADGGGQDRGRLKGQLVALWASTLYVRLTLALCGVYFVVTGVQYWITDYGTMPKSLGGLGADPTTIVPVFSAISVTGPVLGVFFGGWLIDRGGGYKDTNPSLAQGGAAIRTLRTCMWFGIVAALASLPAAFSSSFWVVMAGLWVVLFCGGAMVTPATGVCINAVPAHLRSFGSAMSMFAYNLLGYAAAPLLGGVVADMSSLRWGYRLCVLMVFAAVVLLLVAERSATSSYEVNKAAFGEAYRSSVKAAQGDANFPSADLAPPPAAAADPPVEQKIELALKMAGGADAAVAAFAPAEGEANPTAI